MNEFQTTNIAGEDTPYEKMGLLQRITGIIVSPGRVMDNLAQKPRLLFPLILIAFSQLLLILLRMPLYEDFLRKTLAASSELMESLSGMKMTPEIIELSISQGKVWNLVQIPLGSLFSWLFITLVFFAILKIAGGKGKFKHYLSVTGHAYVISALYLLIVLGVSYITGSLHMDMSLTSAAVAFGEGMKGNFLYGMLKGLDVFTIWYYCIIAIGLTAVSGFKKRTVYSIVAIVFFIGLLIAGAGEAAMGAFL